MYPSGLLKRLKIKAIEITTRNQTEPKDRKQDYLVVPYTKESEPITNFLSKMGLHIAHSSGMKIKDILNSRTTKTDANKNSVIYKIPCNACPKEYYGETSRGLQKRINEHKTSNSLVLHTEECGHLPNWKEAAAIHTGLDKRSRKTIEAAYILMNQVTNHREGCVNLSHAVSKGLISSFPKKTDSNQLRRINTRENETPG